MKRTYTLLLFLFSLGILTQAQPTLNIRLSGNAYITAHRDGARITKKGLENWADPASIISSYFYLDEKNEPTLSLLAKGHSHIEVRHLDQIFNVPLDSYTFAIYPVGVLHTESPGYVRIDIKGISHSGDTFGDIHELIVKRFGNIPILPDFQIIGGALYATVYGYRKTT